MKRSMEPSPPIDGTPDQATIIASLRDLERAHRLLGGTALSRRALVTLATGRYRGPRTPQRVWSDGRIRMLDLETASADLPAALLDWTARRHLGLEIVALDSRSTMLEIADELNGGRDDLTIRRGPRDRIDEPDGAFDIVHCSLLLHRLEPAAAVSLLAEMRRVARLGVIVNDLDRSRLSWLGSWVLSHIATRNPISRREASRAIRRAYRPPEIAQLAARAGLVEVARVRGVLGHRYALAFVPAPHLGRAHTRP